MNLETMSPNAIRRATVEGQTGAQTSCMFDLAEEGFKLAEKIWAATHRDYRSESPFNPSVLMLRASGTVVVSLMDLPLSELRKLAP
jgi:hypothetical protein